MYLGAWYRCRRWRRLSSAFWIEILGSDFLRQTDTSLSLGELVPDSLYSCLFIFIIYLFVYYLSLYFLPTVNWLKAIMSSGEGFASESILAYCYWFLIWYCLLVVKHFLHPIITWFRFTQKNGFTTTFFEIFILFVLFLSSISLIPKGKCCVWDFRKFLSF